MSDTLLLTDRGRVVNFGRVKIPMIPSIFNYDVPLLSFVVVERESGDGYIASCIHLQIDGYGVSPDDAILDMIDSIWHFLRQVFRKKENEEKAWDTIQGLFMSNPASGILWDKYHIKQIELARKGIACDLFTSMYDKIKALERKVSELEKTVKEKDRIISEITKDMVVEYGSVAA